MYQKKYYKLKFLIAVLPIFFLSLNILQAQILKGKIYSQSGDPIQYATVYIQELKQGTTANIKGDYEIRLPAGKYEIMYQSLGFEPIYVTISISDKTIVKDVRLQVQYYQIPEVRISASGEDPAYIIMRKVIGMAPYYLNNISYYKANVYLKGNLIVKKIPRILQKSMKMETRGTHGRVSGGGKSEPDQKIIKEGDSYLMESYNEMEFTAPEKYIQRVISYNSTFPEQGNEISPMSFIQASFYQPVIADMAISPLSPAAFSHYNFKYLGASLQGNFTINKIQVIPKRKSQQLFDGTIYIIEDLWCLYSVDLTNENLVGKIRVEQLYIPVQDDIWMPVSHKFEINIGIVGFKADAGYGSSIKYLEVKPNLSLQKPKTISTNFSGKEGTFPKVSDGVPVTKTKKQIDKILEKNDISNRDMVKLTRLMEKESAKSVNDSSKKSLEIKDHTTHIIEKDAGRKDSSYWAQIRPIPLSEIEMHSLRTNDSMKAASHLKEHITDTTHAPGSEPKNKFFKTLREIALGHTWSDTIGSRFTFGGLIDWKNLNFNTVDGFIYGLDFSFTKSWKNNKQLFISPDILWAFSRKQVNWRLNSYYKFDRNKLNQIYLRTGITSTDINNNSGINPILNSEATLFFKDNFLKLYKSGYLTLGYMFEISNGLNLELSATYEDRSVLQNTTGFSIIKYSKNYSDNVPVNSYLDPSLDQMNALRDQRHADFVTKVTYIPFQRYRMRNGRKIPAGSDWPTFNLTWEHGMNEFSELPDPIKQFDMIRFEVARQTKSGAFSEFRWRVRTGGFLNNKYVTFYDFYHVNSQPIVWLLNDYEDAFMLPHYYSMSTPEFYGEAHIKYTTPYLLLKLLPGLSNTLLRENLSLSYFGSRYHRNYTEIGYSISEIFFLMEIGVYAGFEDVNYNNFGAKVVFKFN
jgi:hypothetical protein